MQYDCYVTMEMQQTNCYTTGTITLLWKCNILIITQQELLRHYGNAIWCIDHVTKENLICHNIMYLENIFVFTVFLSFYLIA
jgi:hypothetical protein